MSETFPELPTTRLRDFRAWGVSLVAIATMLFGPVWSTIGEPPNDPLEETGGLPRLDRDALLSGRYTSELEDWLLARSPASLDLRAQTIALQYLFGVESLSAAVAEPTPGWLFQSGQVVDLDGSIPSFAASRRAFFQALGQKSKELGVRCVIAIGPNKGRAYPEMLYPDRASPPGRAHFADLLKEECEAAGIEFIDPLEAVLDWKRRAPAETAYLRTDTHWTPTASVAAALSIAEVLGFDPVPRETVELGWHPDYPLRADLMRGIRGLTERSFLGDLLFERRDLIYPDMTRADRGGEFWRTWAPEGARIAVAGDSFSRDCVAALQALVPVPMDLTSIQSASQPEDRAARLVERIESGELEVDTILLIHVERTFQRVMEVPEVLR